MLSFSSGLAAALGLVSSQTEWVTTLINTLGATRTLECKRATTNTDVWADGTTFLQAALIGPMAGSGAFVTGFGSVGAAVVQEAADLATGYSVLRISGGGEWVQGTLGLTGSGADFTLRASPAANTGFAFGSATTIQAPASLPLVPPGTVVDTIMLVNRTMTEQPGDFVARMVGLNFKKGDMPAGQWPTLATPDNQTCQYTPSGVTTWNDGSMKFCAALARIPVPVPASTRVVPETEKINPADPTVGKLMISIKNGGTAPGGSSRTLSDVSGLDLNIKVGGTLNLSGDWVASLNDAIASGDDIVLIGAGPAGSIWRVGGYFKQGGSAHGQLYGRHYLQVLQNGAGGLQGVRHLGEGSMPFADVASPAPTRRVMSIQLRTGTTVFRNMSGIDADGNLGSVVSVPHFSGFYTAGTTGHYDYFQAGGSNATECVVDWILSKDYFMSTRQVPAYDLSIPANVSNAVDYYPGSNCGLYMNMGGTGERYDIGVLPTWAVRHLINQTVRDANVVRMVGLASIGWRTKVYQSATKRITVGTSGPSASYAGLGTSRPGWRYFPGEGSYYRGIIVPTDQSSRWYSEYEPSHRPSVAYYPYLITGEPQFLDLLVDQTASVILVGSEGGRTANVGPGITADTIFVGSSFGERDVTLGSGGPSYPGGGFLFMGGLTRIQAWFMRDLGQAASACPDVCPAGTQKKKYFKELVQQSYTAINHYNSLISTNWANSGIYCFDARLFAFNMWCQGYMSNSVCHQASILEMEEVSAFRNYLGKLYTNIVGFMDLSGAIAYNGMIYDYASRARYDRVQDITYSTNTHLSFSSATNRFTVINLDGRPGDWSPTNGDVVQFPNNEDLDADFVDKPFTLVDWKKYYVVNASGKTGQLSATPGGAPIAVTNDVVLGPKYYGLVQNLSPHFAWEGTPYNDGYFVNVTGAILQHGATGDTAAAPAVAVAIAKRAAANVNFVDDPKNAFIPEYPV